MAEAPACRSCQEAQRPKLGLESGYTRRAPRECHPRRLTKGQHRTKREAVESQGEIRLEGRQCTSGVPRRSLWTSGSLLPLVLLLACPSTSLSFAPGDQGSSWPPHANASAFEGWMYQRLRVGGSRQQSREQAGSRRASLASPSPREQCSRNSCFSVIGALQVSGIHLALTHLKTLVVTDRTDVNNTLPGPQQDVHSEEVDVSELSSGITSAKQRRLTVDSNVFCSTGQFLPNGTLLSIGGSQPDKSASTTIDGAVSVRAFAPCMNQTCDWVHVGVLRARRWYSTSQIMPDGRVLIVGGCKATAFINRKSIDNPSVEYWPKKAGEPAVIPLPFLASQLPYNLYPFVHLLPSGRVFIFAGQNYILFDSKTNKAVPGVRPGLAVSWDVLGGNASLPVFRNFPVTATSVMFPLSSATNYAAEIMLCGGSSALAQNPNEALADPFCWRTCPEDPRPKWTKEIMCNYPTCNLLLRRVMGDAVLLVDGTVLILNGAGRGFQGLRQEYASDPVYTPLLYIPKNHSWYQQPLVSSTIPRMYHSCALLLHDASVLVTGSNPNSGLVTHGRFPTEFRVEVFSPPYLYTGLARPSLQKVPASVAAGSVFCTAFSATQNSSVPVLRRFLAVLLNPGFSTHGSRHGMRNVNLDFTSITANGTAFSACLRAPPSLNIAPPGLYWLHILDNGVPNANGVAVRMTAANVQRKQGNVGRTQRRTVLSRQRTRMI